ncbi:MAG: PDK/BCKDK family protein kinase [Terriglobia bacterium]
MNVKTSHQEDGTKVSAAKKLVEKAHYLSQFRQRAVTIEQLSEFGSIPSKEHLLVGARFLHKELPVRIAHRIRELESLPYNLSEMPSVQVVQNMYLETLSDLVSLPLPQTLEDEDRFNQTIETIKQRHNNVVSIMAKGIQELKEHLGKDELGPEIPAFLDRFYLSRIGIRMLIGHYISCHNGSSNGFIGLICGRCSPAEIAEQAIADAQTLCILHYTVAPEVAILGKTDLTFTYIPSHLHHMLFELLKNSLRAVVELHGDKASEMPTIKLVISEGYEDVTIKISDEGGGIPRSGISRIWTYQYTTAPRQTVRPPSIYFNDFHAPMAGLGYGLPLSRLYARYFGGELQVISMEGYGTDAYLHLRRLGDTKESLPRRLT